jgi:tetratricopeptide (TPR) repeat protein
MARWRGLFIILWVTTAGAAWADNKDVARQAFLEGTRLYDLADFTGALEAFKKAYLHYEEPSFLFNIAQCYRQLGNKAEGLRFYKTYLRKSPGAPNANEVRRLIVALESSLEQEKAASAAPPAGVIAPRPQKLPSAASDAPPVVESSTKPSLVASPPPARPQAYKKWWVWTATVGGAAVVATALGVGLTLGQPRETFYQVRVP